MRREELLLLDIIGAADAIARFIRGATREGFLGNDELQSSVLLKLIIIGEAARNMPDDVRTRHPEIEWTDIIGFRNILVHEYFSIRWPTVCDTATDEVPSLRKRVAAILVQEYPDVKLPEIRD